MSRPIRVIAVYIAIVILAGVTANLAAASETVPAVAPAGPTLVTQVDETAIIPVPDGATSPWGRVHAPFDLEPGAYMAVRFIPMAEMTRHLRPGMTRIFTVVEAAA